MPFNHFIAYAPVTAYTVDAPVMINGVNVNGRPYPALNYRPANAQYPLIYLPATEFTRVGANVRWDSAAQRLVITAPNYRQTIAAMQDDISMLKAESDVQKTHESNYGNSKETTRVSRVTANEMRFEAAPATFSGDYRGHYTMGESYPYYADAAMGGQRGITVKDNFGVWHAFSYRVPI